MRDTAELTPSEAPVTWAPLPDDRCSIATRYRATRKAAGSFLGMARTAHRHAHRKRQFGGGRKQHRIDGWHHAHRPCWHVHARPYPVHELL